MRETDNWPFVEAKWYTPYENGQRPVRVIVIHDMEFHETENAAEVIANDFATRGPGQKSSAHICVDSNSIVQCVKDNDIAYAAPGANNDGIHIELTGFARQTRDQWLDEYGLALLDNGANATAQYCLKYDILPVHLTNEELREGSRGIVGHAQVSEVYKKSDHMDPGPGFPWDDFMQMVSSHYDRMQAEA
jgi:N-acetyl-anhydromuramyl-L-alanine amidase AmpD